MHFFQGKYAKFGPRNKPHIRIINERVTSVDNLFLFLTPSQCKLECPLLQVHIQICTFSVFWSWDERMREQIGCPRVPDIKLSIFKHAKVLLSLTVFVFKLKLKSLLGFIPSGYLSSLACMQVEWNWSLYVSSVERTLAWLISVQLLEI